MHLYETLATDLNILEQKHNIIKKLSVYKETNIPSIDIIDLDYIHWHTIQDIPENISKNSLGVVGDVLIDFIYKYDNDVK